MKAHHGTFIGPRAPFGYPKSESNHAQLIPDPKATIIVRKIFQLAANGLAGNYDDGIKIGGRQTIKCVGKNPKLSQAKSKNDKNISGC